MKPTFIYAILNRVVAVGRELVIDENKRMGTTTHTLYLYRSRPPLPIVSIKFGYNSRNEKAIAEYIQNQEKEGRCKCREQHTP